MNTLIKRSLINIWLRLESGLSGPEAASTTSTPTIPNVMEAQINIRVAIFCILLVYQTKTLCLRKMLMLGLGLVRTNERCAIRVLQPQHSTP
jgi:hypothetical protein